ncbi:MAG: hypothetical protein AABW65_03040 [Nanoarchaeota archaeon]
MKNIKLKSLVLFSAFVLGLIFLLPITIANNHSLSSNINTEDNINKGYQCLEDQVKNKDSLSLQQATFAMLALGSRGNIEDKVNSEKKSNEACWPKSGCKIKDSSQILLAYERAGKSNQEIEKWILSKNSTPSDLNWYIEIDIQNHVPAECTLKYDGNERKINIKEDMRIEGNAGNCLSISSSGYWLSVREGCFDKNIEISCNEDFITALLYERKSGGTLYVSRETHSSASLGTTNEKINAKCLKTDGSCDYEGTLWGAFALYKAGNEVSQFIPYLLALAENNQKYFPSSFIYSMKGGEDQYSEITQKIKNNGFWEIIGSPYGRYYDTSLGMLSLSSSSQDTEKTKQYLLSVQNKEGCWNNRDIILDTAFILYSGWPRNAGGSGGSAGAGRTELCEGIAGQSCEIGSECTKAEGKILQNFQCVGFGVCCSIKLAKPGCSEQKGIICENNQKCDGRTVPSSDSGICCLDACLNQEKNNCELFDGICRNSCEKDEAKDDSYSCTAEKICCKKSVEKPKTSKTWIYVLIILIALIIIAIIFRNKIRIWLFKMKGKAEITPIRRPSVPPNFGIRRTAPNIHIQRAIGQRPVLQKRTLTPKEKEVEDTLRKLKEMSK